MNKKKLNDYLQMDKLTLESNFLILINNKKYQDIKFILKNDDLRGLIDIDAQYGIFLRTACRNGSLKIVQLLLEIEYRGQYPDISITRFLNETYQSSPLKEACCSGNIKLVKYLLFSPSIYKNASISDNNYDAFLSAIEFGQEKIVKDLLEYFHKTGHDFNADILQGHFYQKLVITYVTHKTASINMLKSLLKYHNENKLKINAIEDENFGTLLALMALFGDKNIIKIILPYFIDDKFKIEEAIFVAAINNKIENVKYFLLEERFKLSNSIKNRISSVAIEMKNLVEKIELAQSLSESLKNKLNDNEEVIHKEKI